MQNDSDTVEILLGCYNGSDYISEFFDSIIAQDHKNWSMLIRDDGSSDTTVDIIGDLLESSVSANRVRLVDPADELKTVVSEDGNLGPCGNFAELLTRSTADYIMFADQDDVWKPEKISLTLEAMKSAEEMFGRDCPILVHTDLTVVNSKLKTLNDSFWNYQKLDPTCTKFSRLLVANNITGCTVMINRTLADHVGVIPPEALMHDWWCGLCAAAFGKIIALDRQTIKYRQHGGNDTGAKNFSSSYVLAKAASFNASDGLGHRLRRAQSQSLKFSAVYGDRLRSENMDAAKSYGLISEKNFISRRITLIRHKLLMHGKGVMPLIKNIGLMLRI